MHEARCAVDLQRDEEQFYPAPGMSPVPSTTNLASSSAAAAGGGGLHRRNPSNSSILAGTSASAPMSPALGAGRSRAPSVAPPAGALGSSNALNRVAGSSGEMTSTVLACADTSMECSEVSGGAARTADTSFAPETSAHTGITGGTQSASDEMEGEVASISSADASAYLSPSPGLAPHSPMGTSPVRPLK
jgi:hypothetical protein